MRSAAHEDGAAFGPQAQRVVFEVFTPRFFVMCGFMFTVFLSAFQLLPTAPFHIVDLGGSTFASRWNDVTW